MLFIFQRAPWKSELNGVGACAWWEGREGVIPPLVLNWEENWKCCCFLQEEIPTFPKMLQVFVVIWEHFVLARYKQFHSQS